MAEERVRLFSRAYKLAALRRMLAGENVSALARELGIRRKYLYQWRDRFRAGGPEALRSRGRPTKAEALAIGAHGGRSRSAADGRIDLSFLGRSRVSTAHARLAQRTGLVKPLV